MLQFNKIYKACWDCESLLHIQNSLFSLTTDLLDFTQVDIGFRIFYHDNSSKEKRSRLLLEHNILEKIKNGPHGDGLVVETWGCWPKDLMFKSPPCIKCEPTYLALMVGISDVCGLCAIADRSVNLVEYKPIEHHY